MWCLPAGVYPPKPKNYDPLGDLIKWGLAALVITHTIAFGIGVFLGWLC